MLVVILFSVPRACSFEHHKILRSMVHRGGAGCFLVVSIGEGFVELSELSSKDRPLPINYELIFPRSKIED